MEQIFRIFFYFCSNHNKIRMKRFFLSMLLVLAGMALFSQVNITVAFTARNADSNYVQLNRVSITNLTKNWQETIYWPDTTLTMYFDVGIEDDYLENRGFALSQSNPNPCDGTTEFDLAVPEEDPVHLEITDMRGIVETFQAMSLSRGLHHFRVTLPSAGTYVMTARQNGKTSSIKMVSSRGGGSLGIDYLGEGQAIGHLTKSVTINPYNSDDRMEYVGYADICGVEVESGHIVTQLFYPNYTLDFSEALCFLPTVNTDSMVYYTDTTATGGGNVLSDGGAPVTARGVCWSTSHNPTVSDSHTNDGDSTGVFASSLTMLAPATTYYMRAYATNIMGTAYGDEVSFTTWRQFQCGMDTITDIDGNIYNTLQLGNQCWMKENLRTRHYSDGTPIPHGNTASLDVAYWYYPHNDSTIVPLYGLLYNWTAAAGGAPVLNICPQGWHLPSMNEWYQLTSYLTGQSQYWCGDNIYQTAKSLASTIGWATSSTPCAIGNDIATNNATGFGAMPAGGFNNHYHDFSGGAYFWTPDNYSDENWAFRLTTGGAFPSQFHHSKQYGLSVRCIHD